VSHNLEYVTTLNLSSKFCCVILADVFYEKNASIVTRAVELLER